MAPLLEHVRTETKATDYGTEFERRWGIRGASESGASSREVVGTVRAKVVGLGTGPAFLGGSFMSFGAGLAAYSVYHRYQKYTQLSGMDIAGSYENQMEGCNDGGGCPTKSHCQWGGCHCLPGFLQAWGTCVPEEEPDSHTSQQPTRMQQGTECRTSDECQTSDINLVCKGISRKQCQCRNPTRWNSKTGECQIYIGVDCSHLSRESPVPEVLRLSAATGTIIRRGYGTEADDRRQLEGLGLSGPYAETLLGLNRGRFSHFGDSFSTAEESPIPLDRTETPDEALKYSLLSFLPPNISHPDLLEGFCRDLEAFSDIFQMEDLHHRPPGCRPIERQHCAVLYDSSTCSEGSWRLNVTDGEQRQLGYFSSDWKYRLVAIFHPARDKLAT